LSCLKKNPVNSDNLVIPSRSPESRNFQMIQMNGRKK
jgi:hypothetical protein